MKKFLAAALALVMAAMLCSGCSSDEVGFYNTVKNMGALTNYAYSGTISIKLPTLALNPNASASSSTSSSIVTSSTTATSSTTSSSASSSTTSSSSTSSAPSGSGQDATAQSLETARAMLDKASFAYSGVVDSKNKKITLKLIATFGGGLSVPVSIILQNKNGKSVLDVSPFVTTLIPTTMPYTAVTVSGTQYDEYDLDAIIAQLSASQSGSTASGSGISLDSSTNATLLAALQSLAAMTKTSTAQQQDMRKKSVALTDSLINNYFKKFSPGIVKKTGTNTYTCNLTLNTGLTALIKTLTYIEKNTSAFKTLLVKYAGSLTDSEVASLGISGVKTKSALVTMMKNLDISSLSGLSSATAGQLEPAISALTCNVNYKLAKTASKTYKITDSFMLDDTKIPTAPVFFNLSISQSMTVNG